MGWVPIGQIGISRSSCHIWEGGMVETQSSECENDFTAALPDIAEHTECR